MADEKGYNGWSNYETWAVKLWMDNDQGSYNFWNGETIEVWENAKASRTFTRKEQAAIDLADNLKNEHEQGVPDAVDGSVYADLLNAALGEVDWHEIAESLLSAAQENGDLEGEAD